MIKSINASNRIITKTTDKCNVLKRIEAKKNIIKTY